MLSESYWMHIWLPDPPPDQFTEFEKYLFTAAYVERLANNLKDEGLKIGMLEISKGLVNAAAKTGFQR